MKKKNVVLLVVAIVSVCIAFGGVLYQRYRKDASHSGKVASSYHQIYYAFKTNNLWDDFSEFLTYGSTNDMVGSAGSAESDGMQDSSTSSSQEKAEGSSYGTTNVQVENVEEADIVKNDGQYLYIVRNNTVAIVEVEGKDMKLLSTIEVKQPSIHEIYLNGDQLIILSMEYTDREVNDNASVDIYYSLPMSDTVVGVYDIADRSHPKTIAIQKQEGRYCSSRLSDDYLYLFTSKDVNRNLAKDDLSTYVPKINDQYIEADCIVLPSGGEPNSYLIIGAMDVKKPTEFTDVLAVVSGAYTYYVSTNNIYLADSIITGGKHQKSETNLLRISYEKGKLNLEAKGNILGRVNNSFSLDENEGYLRVVTTVEEYSEDFKQYNMLYVLDDTLNVTGKISGIANNESIYSARFMGDTAYFVTFYQTDPLFCVDLSNPKEPKILDALKVTGFSSYLHFYKDNLLLGIGMEVDPETSRQTGIKLSMFDISNRNNIKEVDRVILANSDYSEALSNHKAVLIDPKKDIIGFEVQGYESQLYQSYQVFSYDKNNTFTKELTVPINSNNYNYADHIRGTYVDNTLYVMSSNQEGDGKGRILAYDLLSKEQIGQLVLE